MNGIKNIENDVKRGKLRYLLYLLSSGRLERQDAGELKALLTEELERIVKDDLERREREKELSALIKILDSYEKGHIDLMMHPEIAVSNIT
jgi:hypothetical protein